MKGIILLVFFCFTMSYGFTQTKKDLEASIFQIEEKQRNSDIQIQVLKNELTAFQANINSLNEIISNLSKDNEALNKLVVEQGKLITKMTRSNDSLMVMLRTKEKSREAASMIPRNESDSIVALIQSYYACKNWEDRVHFVLNPVDVEPLMRGYYLDNYKFQQIPKEEIYLQGSDYKLGQVFKVLCQNNLVYCKKTNDGFKIDWEATTGFNPISFKTFKAGLGSATAEYRVTAEIDSYYNFSFIKAQETHWSVRLVADESLAGYISKSTADGKRLNEILMDGKQHQLIVELTTDPEQGNSGGIAVITRIVSESWSKE